MDRPFGDGSLACSLSMKGSAGGKQLRLGLKPRAPLTDKGKIRLHSTCQG